MTSPTCVIVAVPPQLSVAVTAAGLAGGTRFAHSTDTFTGHVSIGAILSNTVMIWAQVALFPHTSVARYVRVTINRLAQVIFDVTSPTCVITAAPPQLSVDVTSAM